MLQTHSAPPYTLGLMSDQFKFHLHLQYQRQFLLIQHLETCRLYLQEATTPLPSCSQLISISKTIFVYSTTWNLFLVPSRSYDSSFVMFLRSICNLESSSFMAFLDSAKALTFSKISLTSSEALLTICCISFLSFLQSQLLVSWLMVLILHVRNLVVPNGDG